jgi:hypothetical protein
MGRTWFLPLLIFLLTSTAMPQNSSDSPARLSIDHVTVCGPDLDAMRQAFAAVGLRADYGGLHASGGTHMALLGFDDGSYLELIAPVEPNQPLPDRAPWPKEIAGNAGPCGWAINVRQIESEVERLRRRGLEASTPVPGGRMTLERVSLEWETAALAHGEDRRLPFLIEDHTPRHLRAPRSASVAGTELSGVAVVVLGVRDLKASAALFQRAFGWPAPMVQTEPALEATVAWFPGTPVMLAAPRNETSWLAERLQRFGEIPAAFLIGTRDFSASQGRFHLVNAATVAGRKLGWFDSGQLGGARLGIVELSH